jgi:hypothetical protein
MSSARIDTDAILACGRLVTDYATAVDSGRGDVTLLFTEDGALCARDKEHVGREAIGASVGNRPPGVSTFHVMSNVAIDVTGTDEARGEMYVTAYITKDREGRSPVIVRMMLGRYRDEYHRVDGRWLFRRRAYEHILSHNPE